MEDTCISLDASSTFINNLELKCKNVKGTMVIKNKTGFQLVENVSHTFVSNFSTKINRPDLAKTVISKRI